MSDAVNPYLTDAFQRIIQRAGKAAGLAVAVHEIRGRENSLCLHAGNQCALCRCLNEIPAGARACRQSRAAAAALARRQPAPIAFVCHMGLGCVSICPTPSMPYIITFGPFCPLGHTEALEETVRRSLARVLPLSGDSSLPFALEDIPLTTSAAVTAIAEWVAEALSPLLIPDDIGEESGEKPIFSVKTPSLPKKKKEPSGLANAVALALAGKRKSQAREYFQSLVTEGISGETEKASLAARYFAMLSLVLEAAQAGGAVIEEAWKLYGTHASRIESFSTESTLMTMAETVFQAIFWEYAAPSARNREKRPLSYRELNKIISDRYAEGVRLSEAAAVLGISPSALTHRLQRRFGMSYSEYLGRLRVEKAKSLLLRSRLDITEVAQRVGITDPSNLGRLFRRYTGMSPTEYRALHAKRRMKKN